MFGNYMMDFDEPWRAPIQEFVPEVRGKIIPKENQLKDAKICRTLITNNGTELTLESREGLGVRKPASILFIRQNNQVTQIKLTEEMNDICLVPGTFQFLCWGISKENGIKLECWDWSTHKNIRSMILNDKKVDSLNIHVYCGLDYLLLHYDRINKEKPVAPESAFAASCLELRDLQSFNLISRDTSRMSFFYNSVYPQEHHDYAVLQNYHGFETWKVSKNGLTKIDTTELEKGYFLCRGMLTDGRTVISGHQEGILRFWRLGDNKKSTCLLSTKSVPNHTDDVTNLIVIPDGKHLVTWNLHDSMPTVTLWDISNEKLRIVNKLDNISNGLTIFGNGPVQLTDEWRIIAPFSQIIEFPELQEAFKKKLHGLVTDVNITKIPLPVGEIVMDYCFFKPTWPSGPTDVNSDQIQKVGRGLKRKFSE